MHDVPVHWQASLRVRADEYIPRRSLRLGVCIFPASCYFNNEDRDSMPLSNAGAAIGVAGLRGWLQMGLCSLAVGIIKQLQQRFCPGLGFARRRARLNTTTGPAGRRRESRKHAVIKRRSTAIGVAGLRGWLKVSLCCQEAWERVWYNKAPPPWEPRLL